MSKNKPIIIIIGDSAWSIQEGHLLHCPVEDGAIEMQDGEPNWCQVDDFDESEPETLAEIQKARAILEFAASAA
jgi:hypothetical protein